jgi:hypothetical protein
LYMEKEMKVINWEQFSFVHQILVSATKRVEFVSDRMSYMVLRGRGVISLLVSK